MEKVNVSTKNGSKEFDIEGDQDVCYNCEKLTEDSIPTEDSAVHFCIECYDEYYCLQCGVGLEGHIMYHPECKPDNVVLLNL
ncbi:MAG: hypothetical protein HQ522_16255 [Bacteroidetes bacterium]|nr:hypothetical protein [Bacteroidota bacterium]